MFLPTATTNMSKPRAWASQNDARGRSFTPPLPPPAPLAPGPVHHGSVSPCHPGWSLWSLPRVTANTNSSRQPSRWPHCSWRDRRPRTCPPLPESRYRHPRPRPGTAETDRQATVPRGPVLNTSQTCGALCSKPRLSGIELANCGKRMPELL